MKLTTFSQLKSLNLGASFLSTGGGGNPQEALEIYRLILKKFGGLTIKQLDSLKPEDICITAFGVGSNSSGTSSPIPAVRQGIKILNKYTKQQSLKGIIPVEIGPKSLATAAYCSASLNVPLINADFVGGRSSPEVFLETITLFNLKRTPAVVTNNQLQSAVLVDSPNSQFEEQFFRNFAINSNNRAYVVGYPLKAKQLYSTIANQTLSKAYKIGQLLAKLQLKSILSQYQGKILFKGKIIRQLNQSNPGFSTKIVFLANNRATAKVWIKNENLILWINNRLKLTCPDLIILLDAKLQPIFNNNLDGYKGSITIIGLPAEKLWKSSAGITLFSPKNCGYNASSKVL